MDSGALDQEILIEVATITTDELGADVETWAEHSRPAAKLVQTPGKEFLAGDVQAESKAVFRIRWRELDSRARVTWRGRLYMVEDVTGTQRDGWTYIHARTTGASE